MADRVRFILVAAAGALVGALALGVVLLFSGLETPLTPRGAGAGSTPAGERLSPQPTPSGRPGHTPPAAGGLSLLRLGPVSGDAATNIAGDLTLGGFTVRERTVLPGAGGSQVIVVGPYSRATIEEIVQRLQRKFPGVPFTIVSSR